MEDKTPNYLLETVKYKTVVLIQIGISDKIRNYHRAMFWYKRAGFKYKINGTFQFSQ